ncbi:MAG: hypothetical protein KAT38_07765, partial [Bacteroidales bacterium]|nr:hypothetical protein [Bacteroidales bacterium]
FLLRLMVGNKVFISKNPPSQKMALNCTHWTLNDGRMELWNNARLTGRTGKNGKITNSVL